MARHHPVEPSARATSSITRRAVRMSAPSPPSASGSATLNSRAFASSMTRSARQLPRGLDLVSAGADARGERTGNLERGGDGRRDIDGHGGWPSCASRGRAVKEGPAALTPSAPQRNVGLARRGLAAPTVRPERRRQPWRSPSRTAGPRSIALLHAPGMCLVGTVQGVVCMERNADGPGWHVANRTLTDKHIHALLIEPESGTIFAGVNHGSIFASVDEGQTWERRDQGLTEHDVYSLACTRLAGRPAHLCRDGARAPVRERRSRPPLGRASGAAVGGYLPVVVSRLRPTSPIPSTSPSTRTTRRPCSSASSRAAS